MINNSWLCKNNKPWNQVFCQHAHQQILSIKMACSLPELYFNVDNLLSYGLLILMATQILL